MFNFEKIEINRKTKNDLYPIIKELKDFTNIRIKLNINDKIEEFKMLKVQFDTETGIDTGYHLLNINSLELYSSDVYDDLNIIEVELRDIIYSICIDDVEYFFNVFNILELINKNEIYLLLDNFPQISAQQLIKKYKNFSKLEWYRVIKVKKAFVNSPIVYMLSSVKTQILLPFEFKTINDLESNNLKVVSCILNYSSINKELKEFSNSI